MLRTSARIGQRSEHAILSIDSLDPYACGDRNDERRRPRRRPAVGLRPGRGALQGRTALDVRGRLRVRVPEVRRQPGHRARPRHGAQPGHLLREGRQAGVRVGRLPHRAGGGPDGQAGRSRQGRRGARRRARAEAVAPDHFGRQGCAGPGVGCPLRRRARSRGRVGYRHPTRRRQPRDPGERAGTEAVEDAGRPVGEPAVALRRRTGARERRTRRAPAPGGGRARAAVARREPPIDSSPNRRRRGGRSRGSSVCRWEASGSSRSASGPSPG